MASRGPIGHVVVVVGQTGGQGATAKGSLAWRRGHLRARLGTPHHWLVIFILSPSPAPSALSSPPYYCPSTSPVPFCPWAASGVGVGGGLEGSLPIHQFLRTKALQPTLPIDLPSPPPPLLLAHPALLPKQKIASCQIGILNSDHARNCAAADELPASKRCVAENLGWAEPMSIRRS